MQKKNSYDEIKGMLNTLRNLNENKVTSKILKEQDSSSEDKLSDDYPSTKTPYSGEKSDVNVINNVEVNISSNDSDDIQLSSEEKTAISTMIDSFKDQVSKLTEFDHGMTINEKQIRLDGTISDVDVSFVLIAGEQGGLYINAEMLKINEEIMVVLDKLVKFEKTYRDGMESLITNRQNN